MEGRFAGRIQNEGLLDVEFRVVEEPILTTLPI